MAGAGRRSGYRKGVQDGYMNALPEPDEEQHTFVGRIGGSRGASIFEVLLPGGEESLAMLPTKFRKLIWIKRGDFVIVQGATGEVSTLEGDGKVRYMIQHILNKDSIRHIQSVDKWPSDFEIAEHKRSMEDMMPPTMDSDDEYEYDDEADDDHAEIGESIQTHTTIGSLPETDEEKHTDTQPETPASEPEER